MIRAPLFLFHPRSTSFSPFYQSLSSVSQRPLPFTASSVICVYDCDSAQNKKQAEGMLGYWSFHLFIKHKRHTRYTLIDTQSRGILCVCVYVSNTASLTLENLKLCSNNWRNMIFAVLGININTTTIKLHVCNVCVQMACINNHRIIVEDEAAIILLQ